MNDPRTSQHSIFYHYELVRGSDLPVSKLGGRLRYGVSQHRVSLRTRTLRLKQHSATQLTGPGQTSVSGLARQRRRVGPDSLAKFQSVRLHHISRITTEHFWRDTWKRKEASDDVASRGSTNNICGLLTRARPFVAGWGCNMLHLLVTDFIENDSSSCCERRGGVMLKSKQYAISPSFSALRPTRLPASARLSNYCY